MFVGSINLHANVDLIIKAFAEAKIPNSELYLYGGGNRKDYCMALVKKMGLENVKFDFVNRNQIAKVQSEASVLVLALPSGNGNLCLPSKMISYMLSGKPILASVDRDSATTRYIMDAKCGLSVEPDDKGDLKDGFVQFGKMSQKELEIMGDNSRLFAEKNLTRKANLPKLIKVFDDILKAK